MSGSWYDLPEAEWQKTARAKAVWEKIADTDPMELWLGKPAENAVRIGMRIGVGQGKEALIIEIPDGLRSQHIYIVGVPGSGKSTLLLNMMRQDIEQGKGFALIDPHGDLVELVLPHIPEHRIADTIYFNPGDSKFPISLNPLVAETEKERGIVTANFMALFTRLFQVTEAPRLLHILRHAVMTLLESGNKTFLDIHTLLINSDFRAAVLAKIHNPYLLEFWEQEFPSLPKNAIHPIVNKLGRFRLDPTIREILGAPETPIDFDNVLSTQKILIANLAEGEIQEENTFLLGSIITSLIQQATMRRASLRHEARPLFTLYIDEFQSVAAGDVSAFRKMLSEARKYNLSVVLAHQYTSQIPKEMRSAILGTVTTMIFFRLGIEDAKLLQSAVPSRTAEKGAEKVVDKLQNLSLGEAIFRSGRADNNFPITTYPPPEKPAQNCVREMIEYSASHYGQQRTKATPPPAGDEYDIPRSPEAEPEQTAEPVIEPEVPDIDPWQ